MITMQVSRTSTSIHWCRTFASAWGGGGTGFVAVGGGMMNSIDHWQSISQEVDGVGFSRQGTLYLAQDEEELGNLAEWLDTARQCQLDSRILSAKEVDKLITDQPGNWAGALYTTSDGRAEPFTAVPAMAQKLRGDGVGIREQCAVRSIDTLAGNVWA